MKSKNLFFLFKYTPESFAYISVAKYHKDFFVFKINRGTSSTVFYDPLYKTSKLLNGKNNKLERNQFNEIFREFFFLFSWCMDCLYCVLFYTSQSWMWQLLECFLHCHDLYCYILVFVFLHFKLWELLVCHFLSRNQC